jgi:hypothetical protein
MLSPPGPVYLIPAAELRRRFNAQGFPARIAKQQVFQRVVKTWPADQSRGLPPNTFTVMTEYVDGQGRFLALTHHYIQRGGGFRTDPDPKQLVENGTLYGILPDE